MKQTVVISSPTRFGYCVSQSVCVYTQISYQSTHHRFLQTKLNHMKDHCLDPTFAQFPRIKTSATSTMHSVTP
jgi:hypothetical protein